MKILISVLFLLFLTSNIVISQEVVTTFYRNGFNNSGELQLYDDNSFVMKYNAVSCVVEVTRKKTTNEEIYGEYSIRENGFDFSPKYKMYKGYDDKETQRRNEHITEGGFFMFSYDLLIYKGEKILVAAKQLSDLENFDLRFDNQYIYLANLLNRSDGDVYFDADFWRGKKTTSGALKINKDIKEAFPEEYKGYVLDEALNGNVKKVEEISFLNPDKESNPNWKKYRLTLDIGKLDGIKPLMILYGKKDNNGNRCSFMIRDVSEDESSGYIQNYSPHYNCSLENIYSTKKDVN